MAKYDIIYSCGHEGVVELLGKEKDRQRKIEWYESTGLCPECYKKEMREKEAKMPLILKIDLEPFNTKNPIVLHFAGNAMPAKDKIKELGYRWGDFTVGAFGILQNPEKAWHKYIPFDEIDDEIEKVKAVFSEVEVKINFKAADVAALKFKIDEENKNKAEYKQSVLKIEKPVKPDCYPDGKWNGRVYGSEKYGFKIYVDGEETKISSEDKVKLEKYSSEYTSYKTQIKELKQKFNI